VVHRESAWNDQLWGVRRSTVEDTRGWSYIWRPRGAIILDHLGSSSSYSFYVMCLHWYRFRHARSAMLERDWAIATCPSTSTPAYLSRHLQPHNCVRNLRSSDTPLLCQPFTKTDLARRGFRYSAPAVLNSLPRTVLETSSITVFKSRLKTHLFNLAYIKQ